MKKRIGIIGGGQLGLMIAQAAHRLDAFVTALDPSPDAPAFADADARIVGAFDDLAALERLCEASDVVTYEFENVPGDILRHLEGKYNIKQGIAPLFDSQDRLREKDNARMHGLEPPRYRAVPAMDDVPLEAEACAALTPQARLLHLGMSVGKIGMPCVLKTRTLGYDGHGQAIIRRVDFDFECSVIMVSDGKDIIHFPVSRNIHREGILDLCIVPASGLQNGGGENDLCRRITASCESFMKSCGYRGILAIELFVKGDRFYFNEMAPRPHNSGHWTIEGCTTSQYMELCHFLLDMPLERPELLSPAVMKNILGQDLDAAKAVVAESLAGAGPGIEVSASEDVDNAFCGEAGKGVHVHLYGKTQSRPKRKMGHITFVPMTPERYYSGWAARFV